MNVHENVILDLLRTHWELSRAGWHKALAIFFTLLPLSFVMDGSTFRFMFAAYPIAIAVMVSVAAVFWGRYYVSSKRSLTGR